MAKDIIDQLILEEDLPAMAEALGLPRNATQADIDRVLAGGRAQDIAQAKVESADELARAAALESPDRHLKALKAGMTRGASAGISDELAALIGGATNEERQAANRALEEEMNLSPVGPMAEIATSVIPTVAAPLSRLVGAGGKALSGAAQIAAGAGLGAAQGAGYGEGAEGRLLGAAGGAALGGGLAAAPILAKGTALDVPLKDLLGKKIPPLPPETSAIARPNVVPEPETMSKDVMDQLNRRMAAKIAEKVYTPIPEPTDPIAIEAAFRSKLNTIRIAEKEAAGDAAKLAEIRGIKNQIMDQYQEFQNQQSLYKEDKYAPVGKYDQIVKPKSEFPPDMSGGGGGGPPTGGENVPQPSDLELKNLAEMLLYGQTSRGTGATKKVQFPAGGAGETGGNIEVPPGPGSDIPSGQTNIRRPVTKPKMMAGDDKVTGPQVPVRPPFEPNSTQPYTIKEIDDLVKQLERGETLDLDPSKIGSVDKSKMVPIKKPKSGAMEAISDLIKQKIENNDASIVNDIDQAPFREKMEILQEVQKSNPGLADLIRGILEQPAAPTAPRPEVGIGQRPLRAPKVSRIEKTQPPDKMDLAGPKDKSWYEVTPSDVTESINKKLTFGTSGKTAAAIDEVARSYGMTREELLDKLAAEHGMAVEKAGLETRSGKLKNLDTYKILRTLDNYQLQLEDIKKLEQQYAGDKTKLAEIRARRDQIYNEIKDLDQAARESMLAATTEKYLAEEKSLQRKPPKEPSDEGVAFTEDDSGEEFIPEEESNEPIDVLGVRDEDVQVRPVDREVTDPLGMVRKNVKEYKAARSAKQQKLDEEMELEKLARATVDKALETKVKRNISVGGQTPDEVEASIRDLKVMLGKKQNAPLSEAYKQSEAFRQRVGELDKRIEELAKGIVITPRVRARAYETGEKSADIGPRIEKILRVFGKIPAMAFAVKKLKETQDQELLQAMEERAKMEQK